MPKPLQVVPPEPLFPWDTYPWDNGRIDLDLFSREFEVPETDDPEKAALSMLRDAMTGLFHTHFTDENAENAEDRVSKHLAYSVQVIAEAARLPLLGRIEKLERQVEEQSQRLAALEYPTG